MHAKGPRLSIFAMLVSLFALSGCATYNTAQHVRPWGDNAWGIDQIDTVTAAWREPSGDIRVCVTGDPAERAHTTAVLFKGVDYSFVLPAGLYETAPESAPKLYRTKDPVPAFNLTAANIEGACPPDVDGAIAIRRVTPGDLGADSFAFADERARAEMFAGAPAGPAVFEFVETPSSSLYYRHDAPVFDGSAIVEIDLALRKKEARPVWILVMPLALVFDVVTSPAQLAMCLFASCPVG